MGPTAEPLIQILETANDVIMKLVRAQNPKISSHLHTMQAVTALNVLPEHQCGDRMRSALPPCSAACQQLSGCVWQVWLVIYLTPFCIASLICSTILQARTRPCCKPRLRQLNM